LVIEYQEYLFVLQKVMKAIDPTYKANFRKNQSVDKKVPKAKEPTTKKSANTKDMQLNLPSERANGDGEKGEAAKSGERKPSARKEKEVPESAPH